MFNKHKRTKLLKLRNEGLECVRSAKAAFANMTARSLAAGEIPDAQVAKNFERAIEACEERIRSETELDSLLALKDDASALGLLRAYLCPLAEIHDEGALKLDLLRDWGFSDSDLLRLRSMLDEKCKSPIKDPHAARGCLRQILHEVDVCEEYADVAEDQLQSISVWLLVTISICLVVSVTSLHLSGRWATLFPIALLLAGAAGSATSVLARLRASEISSSAVSVAMTRSILIRIGTGITASVVGCALLAWGIFPIAVNQIGYSDIIKACGPPGSTGCSTEYSLILLAVPIMFGFSERILTTLESNLFGKAESAAGK
jgi:hypothetical protein